MDPIAIYTLVRRRKRARKRSYWVQPLLQNRLKLGEHLKVEYMLNNSPEMFHQYTRLTKLQFFKLENIVFQSLVKQSTTFREPIAPRIRLFITLRYLATGDSLQSIATNFCVGKSTAASIIHETCDVIWNTLIIRYVKAPDSLLDWIVIAKGFEEKWQLPNCIGALDGKHVTIVAPSLSGSQFHNYKGSFSIVLMALCDANYKFTAVDIGAYGRQSDGGVFSNCGLGKKLDRGELNIDGLYCLPSSESSSPLFFVGDEAFPLKSNLLRPFPSCDLNTCSRIFNYRLSRGRRVIENSFGLLTARFRVMRKPIHASQSRAVSIVQACVALHNFILVESESNSLSQDNSEIHLTNQSILAGPAPSGLMVRNTLTTYFMREGQVSWQFDKVFNVKN